MGEEAEELAKIPEQHEGTKLSILTLQGASLWAPQGSGDSNASRGGSQPSPGPHREGAIGAILYSQFGKIRPSSRKTLPLCCIFHRPLAPSPPRRGACICLRAASPP